MSFSRRAALAGGLSTLALPAMAEALRDAAPTASDAAAWSAYEALLRARLADAGGGRFDEAGARQAFDLTNAARRAAGAAPVQWRPDLETAARAHAGDLARRGYVEHLTPEGFDPSHRFWLLSRTTIGSPSENISYHRGEGPPATPDHLIDRLRRSPGHWANLLRDTHTHAAYALVRGRTRAWLVGLYARPLATLPDPLPFQAQGPDVARALRSLPAELRLRLAVPQGSRQGKVEGAPPVMQLTAIRRSDPGRIEVVGGPIFLATGLG
ncbi:MAG: CAP domain-containing protein [Pseudomonadota bacterium]